MYDLIEAGYKLNLDHFPGLMTELISGVDKPVRDRMKGLIHGVKDYLPDDTLRNFCHCGAINVGSGKLIVCTFNTASIKKPAGANFFAALLNNAAELKADNGIEVKVFEENTKIRIMEDQKEKFIDLLNRHTTPEMVFFNIINKLDNLPADFPQKNKKTLYEMYDALKFSRGKINVDDIRKFNACVSENFVMDDKSAVFWEAINFVWLIAQNAVANRPKFAGIKSGITRKNKQWDILTELSDPLEYACKELLKAENKQKQEIISDVVEQFDNEISAVKQKYKCKQDKYQFFEYYLKVLTNSKEFAMAENNPFKNIVKRRSPRSPESKERSKLGAKNRNQKNKI